MDLSPCALCCGVLLGFRFTGLGMWVFGCVCVGWGLGGGGCVKGVFNWVYLLKNVLEGGCGIGASWVILLGKLEHKASALVSLL